MSQKSNKPVGEIQVVNSLRDMCGIMSESIGGSKYFVLFIDDFFRWAKIYLLREKEEAVVKFKDFEAEVWNHWESHIQMLRTDEGGEYMSKEFNDFLELKGIHHKMTVRDTPEQNRVAEKINRTLCESGQAMLFHAGLSKGFWAEVINTAEFIRNCLITSTTLRRDTILSMFWQSS